MNDKDLYVTIPKSSYDDMIAISEKYKKNMTQVTILYWSWINITYHTKYKAIKELSNKLKEEVEYTTKLENKIEELEKEIKELKKKKWFNF